MDKRQGRVGILVKHFFRRFFDNDTLRPEGDTLTTVVRALSGVAAPGLMAAFFLQNRYHPERDLWASIEDQYLFVLLSFVVMGAVSIFEWEMLFPDRLDFLILSPLSLRMREMLTAKALALFGFLGLFLFSGNVFGAVILPAVTNGTLWRQMFAHVVAVSMAGMFAALFFLALGGVLLCVLGGARFRAISPLIQMISVVVLVLLTMDYVQYGDSLRNLLAMPLGRTRWMAPLWFLGVYETLMRGDSAPAFAREMAGYAVRGTLVATAVSVVTYPLAWVRMQRLAVEGSARRRRGPSAWVASRLNWLVRRPGQRAVFHFIGPTVARNSRYQVHLAMYAGTGIAIALACAVRLSSNDDRASVTLSDAGLHAVVPLLLFWLIAGLRTAFAFPVNLAAGWVFRTTGVAVGDCADAARRWTLLCCGLLVSAMACLLSLARWSMSMIATQGISGACLAVLLTDGFFFLQRGVPFNQPRLPGRTNLPLMLTMYIGIFPMFVLGAVRLETVVEIYPVKLLGILLVTAGLPRLLGWFQQDREEFEEEVDGYEGEFQLLGLS